jgi:hypothetical protein
MGEVRTMTGVEAGLSSNGQMRIALEFIVDNGGTAQITDIYAAVERHMEVRCSQIRAEHLCANM